MQAIELMTHIEWQKKYRLPLGFIGKVLNALIFRKAFGNTMKKYNDNFKTVAEGRQPPHQTLSGKRQQNDPV